MQNAEPLENLADQFARFPGIGRKGAVRMAYEVMSMSKSRHGAGQGELKTAKVSCTAAAFARLYRQRGVQLCASPKRSAPCTAW